jgi:hypothetical protein
MADFYFCIINKGAQRQPSYCTGLVILKQESKASVKNAENGEEKKIS